MPSPVQYLLQQQQSFFHTGRPQQFHHRLENLAKLRKTLTDREGDILQALSKDLGKSDIEAQVSEIDFLLKEIQWAQKHLKSWMKPKKAKTPLFLKPARSYLLPCPLGVVLIMAPWNYPLRLALCPLVGALAAGNCAILKLSPHAHHTSLLIQELIAQAFPPDLVAVLIGDVEEVQELLSHPLGHVFFTGSRQVGSLVAQSAAQHLTPVTLELGGQNPAVVHRDANLRVTVKRLAWAKCLNSGQTCVAPNFAFVHKSILPHFLQELKTVLETWSRHHSWGKIINAFHWERLNSYLKNQNIIHGGQSDRERLTLEPTLLLNPSWDSPVMQEEIFGPLLPVLEYECIEELMEFLLKRSAALSAYLFTYDTRLQKKFVKNIRCGSICINDAVIQVNNQHLPFGGVGESGHGCYHGEYSFLTFSHLRTVMEKPFFFDSCLRYPPYTQQRKKWLRWLAN